MRPWQADQLQELESSDCEQTLFRSVTKFASEMGFDFCAYGMRMPLPILTPSVVMFNNYPRAWQYEYQQKNYLATDPTVHHALRSQAPLVWSDEVFAKSPDLWDDAQAVGLRVGWAQPSRDAQNIVGLLTLARSSEVLSSAEIQDKRFKLAWLAQTAHIGMTGFLSPKFLPDIKANLSSREIDVLRWTAEGKTSGEIAEILRITERTVNFHVTNIVAKLGVANKTAAAIAAAILGYL